MATGTDFQDIYAAEQAAEATKPNMWNPMNWIFSPAESAMPTAEERAAIERSSADIERRGIGEDTSDLSGIAATSVWGNPRYDTTAPFREGDFMDMPFVGQHPEYWMKQSGPEQSGVFKDVPVDPLDPSVHERYPGTTNYSQWWNPNRNPDPRYYSHIFGDQGNNAIDIQENITPEKLTILDEQRSGPVIESEEEDYINQGITGPNQWQKFLSKITRQPYRPAMGGVTMGSGQTYSPAQLNKMNALGGWYSEPSRAARRTQKRVDNMLARREAGKSYSQKNLEALTGRDEGRGSYTATPTRSISSQGPGVTASSGMHGGKHYMIGGRVGYKTGGRVGILSIF